MKTAMIPLGAGTIGLGLGLVIAAWRGDLAAHESGRQPLSLPARATAQASPAGLGLSWVADTRGLRPARAPSATRAPQPEPQPPSALIRSDAAVSAAAAADESLPDDSGPALGEPVEAESYLQARDRAAAHSARSH